MDLHPVAKDTAENVLAAIKYILSLPIPPEDKKERIAKLVSLVGSDFYTQMFGASSEIFDSTAIGPIGYDEMNDQAERMAEKIIRQAPLSREIDFIVKNYYDSILGRAQAEAFVNAVSLDKHPTLTRTMLGETCEWCREKAGTWIYPDGEYFARHAHCDCLIVVSGYNSRNGIVKNYTKTASLRTDEEAMKMIGVDEDYWYGKMENSERMFAKNYPKEIKWINRIQTDKTGKMKPTNDFALKENGKEYELKTINKAKYKSAAHNIRRAVEKAPDVKRNFMINIGNNKASTKLIENLAKYNLRNPNNKIEDLRLFSQKDGEIIIELLE